MVIIFTYLSFFEFPILHVLKELQRLRHGSVPPRAGRRVVTLDLLVFLMTNVGVTTATVHVKLV
jgi:hypothetical protein